MAATFTPEYEVTEVEVTPADGRRRKITKFALAGVAVLGIGAALTSAAWTDDVWFGGSAHTSGMNLLGSVDGGTTWEESNTTTGIQLTMPTIYVAPNEPSTRDVLVWNDSDVPVRLDDINISGAGGIFDFTGVDEPELTASGENDVIPANSTHTITVTVTGGEWNSQLHQNNTAGLITLEINGTTDL